MKTLLSTLVMCLTLAACAVNPVTGERELALISEAQEIAMGQETAASVPAQFGLVENEQLQAYVAEIGQRLAAESERPELPWRFQIVDDPTPNAFALPGGFIFITRGMLTLMNSEAELAAVLGHEIGHVTARHSVNQLSRMQLAQIGLQLGVVVAPELERLGGLADAGLGLLFLKHGRDDERQADELGFNYMRNGGYDVREMADVFAALESASLLAGRSPVPTWLASHPSEAERIGSARERAAAVSASSANLVVRANEYARELEGLVYGTNPRQGYFEDDMFYHPELAFQLAVPSDWQRQNLAAAVMAGSPNRDAAVVLTISEGDIASATRSFFEADGVDELSSDRVAINGNNAIVSRFAAQTQGGSVTGTVAHIEHGGTTYRLLAYAAARSSDYDRIFREIIESFGPLTDPAILGVQPRRLSIVTLDAEMTLAEFNRRYPSTGLSLEELALINQVEGPDARLQSGSAVKRVIG